MEIIQRNCSKFSFFSMRFFLFIMAVVANIKNGESLPPDDEGPGISVCDRRDGFEWLRTVAKAQSEKMDCLYPQNGWGEKWKDLVSHLI